MQTLTIAVVAGGALVWAVGRLGRVLARFLDHAASVDDLYEPLPDHQLRSLRRRHGLEEVHRG